MIGLDTNVLVRYITQDDPRQSSKANRIMESLTLSEPAYISSVSVVELVWVLGACYGCTRTRICEVLEALLRTKELVLADAELIWKALRVYASIKSDFADCLIQAYSGAVGCEYTLTFDRLAARSCAMKLID